MQWLKGVEGVTVLHLFIQFSAFINLTVAS